MVRVISAQLMEEEDASSVGQAQVAESVRESNQASNNNDEC